ncbi:MAG: hypothetical protein ACYTBP_16645 [Planctomycetota bacterium]
MGDTVLGDEPLDFGVSRHIGKRSCRFRGEDFVCSLIKPLHSFGLFAIMIEQGKVGGQITFDSLFRFGNRSQQQYQQGNRYQKNV